MKNIFLSCLTVVLLIGVTTSGCKKDKEPAYPIVDFSGTYLSSTGFNQKSTDFVNSGDYEFGFEFTPVVKGKITSLLVKLPAVRTDLRVTIWNATSKTVLKTELVNVAGAGTSYDIDIADFALTKDSLYAFTMNSNDWYNREKTDGTSATYPVSVGDIKITKYIWKSGVAQVYPVNTSSTYYAGDAFFKFQRVN